MQSTFPQKPKTYKKETLLIHAESLEIQIWIKLKSEKALASLLCLHTFPYMKQIKLLRARNPITTAHCKTLHPNTQTQRDDVRLNEVCWQSRCALRKLLARLSTLKRSSLQHFHRSPKYEGSNTERLSASRCRL